VKRFVLLMVSEVSVHYGGKNVTEQLTTQWPGKREREKGREGERMPVLVDFILLPLLFHPGHHPIG
jgi:hypothetical protein